jgi:hypothetical protein
MWRRHIRVWHRGATILHKLAMAESQKSATNVRHIAAMADIWQHSSAVTN